MYALKGSPPLDKMPQSKLHCLHILLFQQRPEVIGLALQNIFIRQLAVAFLAPFGAPGVSNQQSTRGFFAADGVLDLLGVVITHRAHGMAAFHFFFRARERKMTFGSVSR